MPTYIARISYGKDSLKMLDVIVSRGLPLDRITTSDVWATDTISACLPPVEEFKQRMDDWIYKRYGIKVEHLCARNKDGSKKTYEQMFYERPNRRSDKALSKFGGGLTAGQLSVYRGVKHLNGEPLTKVQGTVKGFPATIGGSWCQKLKLVRDFLSRPRLRSQIKI